ncbi:MAG: GTP-sensing pleiotropic transcriptional regulator CodY [Bacillota bacterium]
MQASSLLDRIREIKQLILESENDSLSIETGVSALAKVLEAAVFLVNPGATVLAEAYYANWDFVTLQQYTAAKSELPAFFNAASFETNHESRINLVLEQELVASAVESAPATLTRAKQYLAAFPVLEASQRLGTLLLLRSGSQFEHSDVILAEIGAALLGLMLKHREAERIHNQARDKAMADVAFDSLSYSEVEAVGEILGNLVEEESIVVASKIADELGITRSVIVNALRKFESAGIIETRSLGMKGTYIKVKNTYALDIATKRSAKMKHSSY